MVSIVWYRLPAPKKVVAIDSKPHLFHFSSQILSLVVSWILNRSISLPLSVILSFSIFLFCPALSLSLLKEEYFFLFFLHPFSVYFSFSHTPFPIVVNNFFVSSFPLLLSQPIHPSVKPLSKKTQFLVVALLMTTPYHSLVCNKLTIWFYTHSIKLIVNNNFTISLWRTFTLFFYGPKGFNIELSTKKKGERVNMTLSSEQEKGYKFANLCVYDFISCHIFFYFHGTIEIQC